MIIHNSVRLEFQPDVFHLNYALNDVTLKAH